MNDIIKRLRAAADDPMWAHHAEVNKATLTRAADEIERLRAALAELVACKNLKDRLDRPSIADLDSGLLPKMRRSYDSRKPLAWEAARKALKP